MDKCQHCTLIFKSFYTCNLRMYRLRELCTVKQAGRLQELCASLPYLQLAARKLAARRLRHGTQLPGFFVASRNRGMKHAAWLTLLLFLASDPSGVSFMEVCCLLSATKVHVVSSDGKQHLTVVMRILFAQIQGSKGHENEPKEVPSTTEAPPEAFCRSKSCKGIPLVSVLTPTRASTQHRHALLHCEFGLQHFVKESVF